MGAGPQFDPSAFRDAGGVDLSDLLGGLFNRGGRRGAEQNGGPRSAAERGNDLQVGVTVSFVDALAGARLTIPVDRLGPCAVCSGSGAKPGTSPDDLSRVPRPRREGAQPGLLLALGAVRSLRRRRHDHRAPVRHLPGRGPRAPDQALRRQHPGRRQGRPAHPPARPRARPGATAARFGDLFVQVTVEPSPVFTRRGDDVIVDVPVLFVEAAVGRDDRGADARRRDGAAEGARGHERRRDAARQGPRRADRRRQPTASGNLLARVKIVVPKKLTEGAARRARQVRDLERPEPARGAPAQGRRAGGGAACTGHPQVHDRRSPQSSSACTPRPCACTRRAASCARGARPGGTRLYSDSRPRAARQASSG